MISLRSLAALALGASLALAQAAPAATLATGPIGTPNDDGEASCRIANLAKKPRTIAIHVSNQNGVEVATLDPTALDPARTGLQSATLSAGESAYCVFDVQDGTGQYRAELCMNQPTLVRHYCVSAR